jgi:hypothetical protein
MGQHRVPTRRMGFRTAPLSLEDAKRLIQQYVDHYNHVRLPQRDRVRGAEPHTQGSASRDPRGARPEAGSGSPAAPNCDGARRTGQMAIPRATEPFVNHGEVQVFRRSPVEIGLLPT